MPKFCIKEPDGKLMLDTLASDVGYVMHLGGFFGGGLQGYGKVLRALLYARRKGYRIVQVERFDSDGMTGYREVPKTHKGPAHRSDPVIAMRSDNFNCDLRPS